MRTAIAILFCAALISGSFMNVETAEARPKYMGGFAKLYKEAELEIPKVKCLVCHEPKDDKFDKEKRNVYGKAYGKGLEKKNEGDAEKIVKALKEAEKMKSAIEGKTFGDLIKDGKLPATMPKKED